jgi:hypothetical protein
MIYGRTGNEVKILRMGTIADVKALDHRKADAQDRDAVKAGAYVVVLCFGELRLYHLAFLRADDGVKEIDAAIAKVKTTPAKLMVMMNDSGDMPRAFACGPCDKLLESRHRVRDELKAYIAKKAALGETLEPSDFKESIEVFEETVTP